MLNRAAVTACLIIAVFVASNARQDDIAAANFDDGTAGPFSVEPPGSITFPDDPTGSSRGRIARLSYNATKTPVDVISALELSPRAPLGLGSTFFFAGDVFIPIETFNFTNPNMNRKLISFRGSISSDSTAAFFVLLHLWGACGLQLQWSQNGKSDVSKCGVAPFKPGTWTRIETQVTMNSSMSATDGALRLWIGGVSAYENTAVRFTDPGWRGTPVWKLLSVGYRRRSADGGDNPDLSDGGSINELRYWDDVSFSTKRIVK